MTFGVLRDYLARDEIAAVDRAQMSGEALVVHAAERLAEAHALETSLRELVLAVELEPRQTLVLVESFLRRTSPPESLSDDLRALKKSRGARPSIGALSEGVATKKYRLELAAEIALAKARELITGVAISPSTFEGLLDLARRPGRHARRVEALRVLGAAALEPSRRRATSSLCEALARPDEHRWVQPAAIDLLASADPNAAIAIVRARFAQIRPGEDFIVRERFVDLSTTRGSAWQGIVELAAKDPSEHVRLSVARHLENRTLLTTLARQDVSAKVRARAILTLVERVAIGNPANDGIVATLIAAIDGDGDSLPVETAAACATLLARARTLALYPQVVGALTRAAARSDLSERTKGLVIEELAAVVVLADPSLRAVHDLLDEVLQGVPVGAAVKVAGAPLDTITDEQMGRVLSVLARDDFGLSAERSGASFVIYRGEDRGLRSWRVLRELAQPLPSKRQAHSHGSGRVFRGSLRAPPRRLAELTPTNVPGERVLVSKRGDWGRHLPLVDDLLASPVLSSKPLMLYGPSGSTSIEPPASFGARVAARLKLTLGYAQFAEQRRRALESDEPSVKRGYVDRVANATGIRIRFEPYGFAASVPTPAEVPRASAAFGLAVAAGPISHWVDGISDLGHYALRMEGNRLPHVAAYAAVALFGMLTRAIVIRRSIELDRKAIPLVLGGWGTRGKSGTERLKAGLLQGLGYEVLVKTTGCEAMFIHALPGLRAQEVFIYRPYDKATIWEQRDLLRLARRFGVRAFLWECMALQPDLVNLLQEQWMRDDYSTITNAYPDHEDVQGPTGQDVAEVISEFVPTNGRLVTSEDQMLPILRERAKGRKTTCRAVGELESALISDDILARFPYHEHPRNIALVCALAGEMGVPQAVALVEMADNVVPDLGVLKTYPRAAYAGRTIAFTNGMSANERTGALSNWTRMGFDQHEPEQDPSRWLVTVCNNRADRVARSEVFARFLVEDVDAHQHVLIGTNVSGLLGLLRDALERHLEDRSPIKELAGSPEQKQMTIAARIDKAFARLKIGVPTPASVAAEMAAFGLPPLAPNAIAAALTPVWGESVAQARAAVAAAINVGIAEDARSFVVSNIARRRVAQGVRMVAMREGLTNPRHVDITFRSAYRDLFMERIVPLTDSTLTGDQLIDRLARGAPPGARIDVMGVQNIKGTGLDFVYRWISLDTVTRALAKVRSSVAAECEEGLNELLAHDDFGLVDSVEAVRVLESTRASIDPALASLAETVVGRIRGIAQKRAAALHARHARKLVDRARAVVGITFDYLDSVRRQSAARRVLEELIRGHISHAAAALEMRSILARAKGAWAL